MSQRAGCKEPSVVFAELQDLTHLRAPMSAGRKLRIQPMEGAATLLGTGEEMPLGVWPRFEGLLQLASLPAGTVRAH